MQWFASAPSNIALIKYMGKRDSLANIPINPSLSYTLNDLISSVTMESYSGGKDCWEPLTIPGATDLQLKQPAIARFLDHLQLIKREFAYDGHFIVRSNNNFPQGSGLASSASSFAALTICAVRALSELTGKSPPTVEDQAKISRQGSGSSCRSFFSPWALWDTDTAGPIKLPYQQLHHQVILVSHAEKAISSSAAHLEIQSSPLFVGRELRAEKNLKALLIALQNKQWTDAYHICWREFWDMHKLFTTASSPFDYMTTDCKALLQKLQRLWEKEGDGPIVTMDAGPNIHLLYREDQQEQALRFKSDNLIGNYDVL